MKPIYDMPRERRILQTCSPTRRNAPPTRPTSTYGTTLRVRLVDYLRDNMAQSLERKVQNGGRPSPRWRIGVPPVSRSSTRSHNILIDEARTP